MQENLSSPDNKEACQTPLSDGKEQAKTFISEAELVKRLPVCRRTLADWRSKGLIPSIKVQGRVIFHLPSVEAALLRLQK